MAHSNYGWTCGCAGTLVTVKSLENTRHTWTLVRWWFTTKRRYIKCIHLMHLLGEPGKTGKWVCVCYLVGFHNVMMHWYRSVAHGNEQKTPQKVLLQHCYQQLMLRDSKGGHFIISVCFLQCRVAVSFVWLLNGMFSLRVGGLDSSKRDRGRASAWQPNMAGMVWYTGV